LHGLLDWVQKGLADNNNDAALETILASIRDADLLAVEELAKRGNFSKISEETFSQAKPHWDNPAAEFTKGGLGEETPLCETDGGVLSHIDHCANNADHASLSRGAMQLCEFKLQTGGSACAVAAEEWSGAEQCCKMQLSANRVPAAGSELFS